MSLEPGPSFDQLAELRRALVQDVRPHRRSINFFATNRGFAHTAQDVTDADTQNGADPPPVAPITGEPAKGITTAFTCFESLNEAILDAENAEPSKFAGLDEADRQRLEQFVSNAFVNVEDDDAWRSEKSARTYCIVRGLPPLLRLATEPDRETATTLIKEVWQSVGLDPDNCGVYEVAPRSVQPAPVDGVGEAHEAAKYPPNAFLTYWALRAVQVLELDDEDDRHRKASTNLWLRAVIGRELALHRAGSRVADPQQLAWAIAALVAQSATPLADHSDGTGVLLEAGLDAFFEQQGPTGTWDTGRPLFHYLEAGNAYCYIYETLAELLALALDRDLPASAELRRHLRSHLPGLLLARRHLLDTARPLGDPRHGLRGWSSGHHPHRTSPESWATATAFRFLQGLRRLVGLEVRHQAEVLLQARRPKHDGETLAARGRTWDAGHGEAGRILTVGLVDPIVANNVEAGSYLDPDLPRIPSKTPRSAILFGPPGTGKTTLAEGVAGALGWSFVEVTSADFLSTGSDRVSARADEIFRQLMELDQTVVLFDEVDELIRRRSGPNEMAGRFFTTTMLPRLSRLWDGGRTVFFLNTNGIHHVDAAVRRSQRFDAAILVMPPSYEAKLDLLPEHAKSHFDKARVEGMLDGIMEEGKVTHEDAPEAWLAFLRYDQLMMLTDDADKPAFLKQLTTAGEELPSDWELAIDSNGDTSLNEDIDRLRFVVRAYHAEQKHQRLDTSFRHRLFPTPEG
jgi:hypothetical protein